MVATAPLTIRDFLEDVREGTLSGLAPGLGEPVAKRVFSSLQIHFGEPRLHYEVWPVRKTGRIEVGLHIEGPQEWSREVAVRLASQADDLRSALGSQYELEDWTASWCRLHTTLPLGRLTESLAADVAAATVRLIEAAEPIVRALDLPAPSASSKNGRSGMEPRNRSRWGRRRGG